MFGIEQAEKISDRMIKLKRTLGNVLRMRTSQWGMCKGSCSLYSVWLRDFIFFGAFVQFHEACVRRTNFDKKMLIDKNFTCRRADSHRFGAPHPLLSFSKILIKIPVILHDNAQQTDHLDRLLC